MKTITIPDDSEAGAREVLIARLRLLMSGDAAMARTEFARGTLEQAIEVLSGSSSMGASAAQPDERAAQVKCQTCNDNGMIGGPSYSAPDEGGVPCPDCATSQQATKGDGLTAFDVWAEKEFPRPARKDSLDFYSHALKNSAEKDGQARAAVAQAGASEPVDYDRVVSICDAHGIGLPVDCIEMVVEIVRHAAPITTAFYDGNHVENHCPECSQYESECECAPIATRQVLTDEQREAIMAQAQVFASAWSLIGSVFDFGAALVTAEQERENLRALLAAQQPSGHERLDRAAGNVTDSSSQ